MERILINFDKSRHDDYMRGLRRAISDANEIVAEINKINSYQMDADALRDLIYGAGERGAEGIQRASEADIKKAGIRSKSVHDLAIKGDQESYYTVINKYSRKPEYAEGITITNGRVCLKDGFEETVKERYSSYIETEKGKAIYDAQQKLVDAINEILGLSSRISNLELSLLYAPVYGERKVELNDMNYDQM